MTKRGLPFNWTSDLRHLAFVISSAFELRHSSLNNEVPSMHVIRYGFAFLPLGLLCFVSPGQAAKVKVWQQQLQSHFDKAHFKQAIVTSEGTLRLSRQAKMIAN